jgi:probable phosphoglycerate mutase
MEYTRIIAIRHGETSWNVDTRIQGQLDIGLNPKGHWQAQQVGKALAHEDIHHVYSSDLIRAHATATAIAQAVKGQGTTPVRLHQGLRERAFGTFEGQTWAEIETHWPDESRRWRQRDPTFAPPGGENPVQVMQRVEKTLTEIASQHLGEQIVLVAHGGIMDMLYRLATRQGIETARTWNLGNATINRLLWTPHSVTLVGWGDARHLDESVRDESSA